MGCKDTAFFPIILQKCYIFNKVLEMAQEKVSRAELLEMHIGQTRIFTLTNPTKLQSVASQCNQLKNEQKGEWTIKRDYSSLSISVTRVK
jgi:hypothetical protein